MSTRVVNIKLKEPFDIYIGRPMPGFKALGWGNPFRGGYNAHSVGDAISAYRRWLLQQEKLIARLPELRDMTLGCWCAPAGGLPGDIEGHVCHGEILAALADDPQLAAVLVGESKASGSPVSVRQVTVPHTGQVYLRRCGNALPEHRHTWQPWGSDARYVRCSCGVVSKAREVTTA